MKHPTAKSIALALIIAVLVVSSFAVGNFGLNGGSGPFALELRTAEPKPGDPAVEVASWFESRGFNFRWVREDNFAMGFIWVCVALALLDSFRGRDRVEEEETEDEVHTPRPRFKKLKHPPSPGGRRVIL